MKVSIVIPVYNVAKYIERCLLSALNQAWQDLEVILVNDCTPDNSMQIAETVIASHPRRNAVRCLSHEKNRGQSAARNTGIGVATGDYLFFLDSDDYLPLDSISTLAASIKETAYDFILGNYEIMGKSRAIHSVKMEEGAVLSNEEILSAYARDLWPRTVWNMLIKRDFLLEEKIFFEEGIIHEDDLWTFILACKASSAYFVKKITYYYYIHYNSTTGNPSIWNLECRVRIIELMYNYIQSSEALKRNRSVYVTFEEGKSKYMDRIIYFTKDKTFWYQCYQVFREKKYISSVRAMCQFSPSPKMILQNIHYGLPVYAGYLYFVAFVKLCYYLLVLPIKIKGLLHLK